MFVLAGERQPLAITEVDYCLRKAQGRHETWVENVWERSVSPVLAEVLAETIGTAGLERASAVLASGTSEDRHALATEMSRLFIVTDPPFPSWVGEAVIAEAAARVQQIIEDSGPSDDDAASWAPIVVAGAGTYVLACAIADCFDARRAEGALRSS